jgi:hypothetical protein
MTGHDPGLGHRRKEHGRAQVVAGDVLGCVREVLAEADHGRLVADGLHAAPSQACNELVHD